MHPLAWQRHAAADTKMPMTCPRIRAPESARARGRECSALLPTLVLTRSGSTGLQVGRGPACTLSAHALPGGLVNTP